MKNFKEWLSDYLRYIILLLVVLLIFALVLIGYRGFQNYRRSGAENAIQILDETEQGTEGLTGTESGMTEPDSENGSEQETEKETEQETEEVSEPGRENGPETEKASVPQTDTEGAAASGEPRQNISGKNPGVTDSVALPEAAEPQTEQRITETEAYEPVYMTLNGACNFRSGPSYEAEVVTWYPAGTVVEFLEDAGGWYKVQIDGMIGYMGARFLE